MSNKLSAKEKLQKEIDDLLSKAFPQKEEEVKKSDGDFDENLDAKASSTDISVNANGGEDVIKNKDKKDELVKVLSDQIINYIESRENVLFEIHKEISGKE